MALVLAPLRAWNPGMRADVWGTQWTTHVLGHPAEPKLPGVSEFVTTRGRTLELAPRLVVSLAVRTHVRPSRDGPGVLHLTVKRPTKMLETGR